MKKLLLLLPVLVLVAAVYYLTRPIPNPPSPAEFVCLNEANGTFKNFDSLPQNIYGFGLSYRQHIVETSAYYNPIDTPPIFRKGLNSIVVGEDKIVKIPSDAEMKNSMNTIESGLADVVYDEFPTIKPLVDYEVELGIIILEDISKEDLKNENFVPKLGFFIANDISERCIAILGDGQPNQFDYWGISKNFAGFTPLPEQYWIPNTFEPNQIPCIQLKTLVNGMERQNENTSNMIYTPIELLHYISAKYNTAFLQGDIILSGTSGGTAIHAPRWKIRVAKLLGLGRFKKLDSVLGGNKDAYLKSKDKVEVQGEWLGKISVTME
jgi:2-keto-4-pentenoate hydratase/2-oxohepta-3-ene-1,7-dioic acid hydratase in catechol pathway